MKTEQPISVLLADDHPVVLEGLRQALESQPTVKLVAEARDGLTALRLIESVKPAVAVLDIEMPNLDGLDVARQIQLQGTRVAVVILTMYQDENLFNAALDAGVMGYVLKENAVAVLVSCVEAVAEGLHFICPLLSDHLLHRQRGTRALVQRKPGLGHLTIAERKILRLVAEGHTDEFTSPSKVRVAAIFLRVPGKANDEQVNSAQKRAEEIRAQALGSALAGPDFGLLAQDNSDDQATRYRGGDCGFLTRTSSKVNWHHTVREAAFALKQTGEISPIIRAPDGFYLLKLIERKEAERAPLVDVRSRIEKRLQAAANQRARERFEAVQRRGVTVQLNEPLLEKLNGPALLAEKKESGPPAMPVP